MSIAAPAVLLDEVLTTQEFANSVYIAPEEKLTVRSAAISKSKSQLTFQVRQPAPQAILENCPRLELVLRYEFESDNAGAFTAPTLYRDEVDTPDTSYGCMPGPYVLKMRAMRMSTPFWRW